MPFRYRTYSIRSLSDPECTAGFLEDFIGSTPEPAAQIPKDEIYEHYSNGLKQEVVDKIFERRSDYVGQDKTQQAGYTGAEIPDRIRLSDICEGMGRH